MKKAFTMLELVMVMVIMGIVASIGAEIIASMYSNYLRSRTINRLEAQTEITLEQIAKRLQYRIKDSVIARKTGTTPLSPADPSVDQSYNVLEWIGASNESFLGTPRPGWSGFIDLDNNNTNRAAGTLKTSESNLTDASNTMSELTNGDIDLTNGREAALVFKGISYNIADFGWGTVNNSDGVALIKVSVGATSDILTISNDANPVPTEITEQYTLAHTAYAIVPGNTNPTDFNLTLRYNYQPWNSEEYTDGNTSVLAEHASLFRFKQDESILRLKLCLHDANLTGVGDIIVVCKEKVIY